MTKQEFLKATGRSELPRTMRECLKIVDAMPTTARPYKRDVRGWYNGGRNPVSTHNLPRV